MAKNIIGDWGAGLNDRDYARALAALGSLEASRMQKHQVGADPQKILAALQEEFKDGDRTVVWRAAQNVGPWTTPESWRQTIHGDAQALADGWGLLLAQADHPRRRPRLAVRAAWRGYPHLFDFNALLGWLSSPDTACQALVLAPEDFWEEDRRTLWHWPLRVGLPTGVDDDWLLDHLQSIRNGWIEQLGIIQPVGEARDACDLLILAPGLAPLLADSPQLSLRASFIVCLDDPVPWRDAPDTPQAWLRARMKAAGMALVGNSFQLRSWYEGLMRELSHDMPVPAALWAVGRQQTGTIPVIVGEPEALDRLRIMTVADRSDHKLQLLAARPKASATRKRWMADTLAHGESWEAMAEPPGEPKMAEPSALKGELGAQVRARMFNAETVDGLPIAAEIAKQKVTLEEKRRLRWIQAQIWREDTEDDAFAKAEPFPEPEPAKALAPVQPSLLTVHIGPEAQPYPAFPDSQINFRAGPVEVTVQVELAGAEVKVVNRESLPWKYQSNMPVDALLDRRQSLQSLFDALEPAGSGITRGTASAGIMLPEAGDSDMAIFAVRPQTGIAEVTGRISIIHQNRIIQIAQLRAPVRPTANEGPGISVQTEAAIYPRLDDLAERRIFDAALMVADDIGGHLSLTVNRNGGAQDIPLDNLSTPIENIRKILQSAVINWNYAIQLKDQPVLQPMLLELAANGRLLYDQLRGKLGQEIDKFERYQLVCRGNAFFPLEYVYSGPSPDLEAEVCPNATNALLRGGCHQIDPAPGAAVASQANSGCPNAGSKNYLCPMHFWGFAKVIERHGDPGSAEKTAEIVTEQRFFPVPNRLPFGPIQAVLYAASAKAFAFRPSPSEQEEERQNLAKALSSLSSLTNAAQTWDEWRAWVKQNSPNLLLLIAHTDKKGMTIDVLEIGEGKQLGKHQIDPELIGDPTKAQLLLLLGCSAAEVTEDFAPYPEKFRLAGADVILAPLAPIRGADALPIAERIAQLLGERLAGDREMAFGELLRELRQKLLAEGHPGVLSLVGFGDADWIFGGHHA